MPAVANVSLNLETNAPRKLREVQTQAQQTEKAVDSLGGAIGQLAGAFSAFQAAKFIFAKTAEIESQTKSLEVLTGSAIKAKQIIQELQQLGAVTPFTSTELIDSAKRLQAFGVATNEVVETTRRLADVSGATGAELQGLVTAYGQVQAKGRLQGEELLQFQERGVALQKILRDEYKLSGENFQKALQKGQISAEAVEYALIKLTDVGGKYANGAIAQSSTLEGKFSTLQDAVEGLARTIGNVFAPLFKYLIDEATNVINVITDAINMAAMGPQKATVLAQARAGKLPTSSLNPLDYLTGNTSQQKLFELLGQGNAGAGEKIFKQLARQSARGPGFLPDIEKLGQLISQQPGIKAKPQKAKPQSLPPLLSPTGAGAEGANKASKEAKKLADELAKSVLAGDRLGREYSRQVLQLAAIDEAEQERNRIQAAYEDRALDIKDLKNAEQQTNLTALNDEIRRLELQKLQTEELKKQAAEYIKLIPIFAQFNEDLGALAFKGGPLGAGIGGNVGVAFGGTSLIGAPQNEELTKAKEALNALVDPINQVKTAATSIGGAFSDSFRSVITGSMSAQEALAGFFKNVANSFLDMASQIITQLIVIKSLEAATSIFGGGGGFKGFSGAGPVAFPSGMNIGVAGFKANGGPVGAGKTYMVGEKGPELFVPSSSGNIVPNNQLGGGPTSVVVNVDASGSNVQGDQSQASQLGKVIGLAVQQELIKQKRPGGLLA